MELTLNQIIALFIVFVTILFAIYLLSSRSKNYISNVFITIFLIFNAIDSAGSFISIFVYPRFPGLGLFISTGASFLQVPALYLYILSTIYSDFKLKKKDLLHLLPFLIVLILFIPSYYFQDFDTKQKYLKDPMILGRLDITYSYIILHLQALLYIILSFQAIFKYKHLLLENYSNANMFSYHWMLRLISIYTIIAILGGVRSLFMFLDLDFLSAYALLLFAQMLILGFICWMVLKALHSPELFTGISSDMQLVKNYKEPHFKDHGTMAAEKENSKHIQKLAALDQYMLEKRPFLDASLTLYDLADQLGIKKQDLSLLINKDLNQHFFDFINGYRIRLAMDLLTDPSKKNFTVLEILYEVGFNSKSSFNTAFKKITNYTPTQYRQKYLGT